jgi:predicted dehydrogenase
MNEQKVHIGLVGVANHGATILDAILASGNLQLETCYDTDLAASEQVSARTGCRIARSYEELSSDPKIQAVALVTPNHLHADQFKKAVSSGKHIFVEKPISNTIAEAKEMIALAKKSGRVLMVGHNTRRRRVFRRTKQLLQEGSIGKIVAVEGNVSRSVGLQPGLPPWKADPAKCPLLPMTQLGIHFVDTISFLLEPVKSVSCIATNIAMPGSVYDSTAAVLQLESGIPFALTSCYVSPDAYFIKIYGTKGSILCHATHLRVEWMDSANVVEEDFQQEGAECYMLQMREFGECISGSKQPETGGQEGLYALAAIEAMTRSVASGRLVTINEVLQEEPL